MNPTKTTKTAGATAPAKLAVVYVRISKWRDNETSTQTQMEECKRYAAAKGWVIPEGFVLTDEGRSAYKKGKRPGFDKAMSLVETGQAQALIVWKLSRFMRSATEFVKAYDRIREAGAEFVSVTEAFDTSTVLGRLGLNIMASIAEMESEIKSDNAKTWHEYRRNLKGEDGTVAALPNGGGTAFGYTRLGPDGKPIKNTLLVVEANAQIVRDMYALAIETRGNLTAVARAFANVEGTPKDPAGIRWLLRNPVYVAKRLSQDKTELVQGCWPAIVDEEVWQEVTEMLADPNRKTVGNGNGNDAPAHMLTSFIFCGRDGCGSRMVSKWYKERPRYLCRECGNVIVEALADEEVVRDLLARLDRKAWQALKLNGRTATPAAQAQLDGELATLKRMYDANEIGFDEWVEMRKAINATFEQASTRKAVKLPDVEDLRKAWPAFTLKQQRMVVGAALERVTVSDSQGQTLRGADRVLVHYTA